ncbi:MAG: DNA polymerase III subunit epsilon [Gammaproteobacteria bacterium]
MRQIVLDTETTGLSVADGHRIIEMGGVELVGRRLTGKHFHRYINPQREIDAGALQIHGITQSFLADKPLFREILDELLVYLEGAELIIHNASFDISFLDYELQLAGKQLPSLAQKHSVIDTLQLARQKHPGQPNKLDALCKRYGVDNTERTLHGALLDARLLAEVYLAMTGGQGSLFEESALNPKVTRPTQIKQNIGRKRQPLTVIMADVVEEQAHQRQLAAIQKASGKCKWMT